MERIKILTKLNLIQKEVTSVSKEGVNAQQGYKYLAETQVTELFKPLLEKNGVMFLFTAKVLGVAPTVTGKQNVTTVEVQYEFVDVESGEAVKGTIDATGSDSNDKGVYKAITGGIKYIFMKTFLLPTGDDPENDKGESVIERETPPVRKMFSKAVATADED